MNQFDQNSFAKKSIIRIAGLNNYVTAGDIQALFITFGPIVKVAVPLEQDTNEKKDQKDANSGNVNENIEQNIENIEKKEKIPKNRGFAIIEYEDPDDAEHAIGNMNDFDYFGNTLKVSLAQANVQDKKTKWDVVQDDQKMKD
jgi:RNA recognition motif-containing protein